MSQPPILLNAASSLIEVPQLTTNASFHAMPTSLYDAEFPPVTRMLARPTTSVTFSANFGSFDSLNLRSKCGLRPASDQMRCALERDDFRLARLSHSSLLFYRSIFPKSGVHFSDLALVWPMPTAFAMVRALQCVALAGVSFAVLVSTISVTSATSGGLRDGRVLSRSQPSIPSAI